MNHAASFPIIKADLFLLVVRVLPRLVNNNADSDYRSQLSFIHEMSLSVFEEHGRPPLVGRLQIHYDLR